jgi:hypothetical protein
MLAISALRLFAAVVADACDRTRRPVSIVVRLPAGAINDS